MSASAFGFSASHDGLSVAAGGGLQWSFSPRLSAQASADYVMNRHNVSVPGLPSETITLNNVRVSVGIVYSFGGTVRSAPRSAAPSVSRGPATQIPELGIDVETAQEGGARIVAVTPVGLGERAGLRVGDTIRAVEGKAIRSGQQLATELASRPSGSRVGLSYTRGYWGSEAIIVIDQR